MDARRITVTLGATAGGLLAGALLSATAALADTSGCTDSSCLAGYPSGTAPVPVSDYPGVPGNDAFTLGGVTYDPITFEAVPPADPNSLVQSSSTIVEGWNANDAAPVRFLDPQQFVIYSATDSSATPLGIAESYAYTENFFGVHNSAFILTSVVADPNGLSAADAAQLPAAGTFYDVMNFGMGFENVYRDILGADGAPNAIVDEFVTPFGDFNIPTTIDYFDLDPGAAFVDLP